MTYSTDSNGMLYSLARRQIKVAFTLINHDCLRTYNGYPRTEYLLIHRTIGPGLRSSRCLGARIWLGHSRHAPRPPSGHSQSDVSMARAQSLNPVNAASYFGRQGVALGHRLCQQIRTEQETPRIHDGSSQSQCSAYVSVHRLRNDGRTRPAVANCRSDLVGASGLADMSTLPFQGIRV
jgi:hypothetical protein